MTLPVSALLCFVLPAILKGTLDSECRLLGPRRPYNLASNATMMKRIAAALVTRFSEMNGELVINRATAEAILGHATKVEVWGRLKRMGAGDTMLACEIVRANAEDRRDATFVRVSAH